MITVEKIEALVTEKILNKDLFLVDIRIRSGNRISVFIDSDTSVNIKDCVEISRYIESNLDRESEDFELEVSSAGLDQPFKQHRQFRKNLGNDLKIITVEDKTITATLLSLTEESITLAISANKKLKTSEQQLVLPFKEIKEAKIVIKINNKKQ